MKKSILSLVLITLAFLAVPVWAQGPHRAGLVVQFPDGQVETLCVEFAEAEITGAHLLDRSGLTGIQDYSSGLGAKVCKIEETGCDYPGENCWCQCQGSPCAYWNYWQWKDGRWVYSPVGASDRRLRDGDIDSWVWGDGQNPPPPVSLDEICQAAVETPEATALLFASPLDTPTAQPAITRSPLPRATLIIAGSLVDGVSAELGWRSIFCHENPQPWREGRKRWRFLPAKKKMSSNS